MTPRSDGYSRAVAVLKVILPLVALAILSTLFLLARPGPRGQPIPFADVDMEVAIRTQRLGAPVYQGVTADGSEVRLTARALHPDTARDGVVHATDLLAQVRGQDGSGYDLVAATGTLDRSAGLAQLQGGVRVATLDGYRMRMPAAEMDADLTWLESRGPVTAEGPLGTLSARHMSLRGDPDKAGQALAVFKGDVKLIYLPQRERTP